MLDECDEMLNMGFVDDVEMILNAGGSSENMQTLLFSATLPPWVKDITRRFLRKEQRTVDLVGSQKMQVRAASFWNVDVAAVKCRLQSASQVPFPLRQSPPWSYRCLHIHSVHF